MLEKVTNWLCRKCLPFYFNVGKYRFSMYAMYFNWETLRIKIQRTDNWKIVKVIKKGKY